MSHCGCFHSGGKQAAVLSILHSAAAAAAKPADCKVLRAASSTSRGRGREEGREGGIGESKPGNLEENIKKKHEKP